MSQSQHSAFQPVRNRFTGSPLSHSFLSLPLLLFFCVGLWDHACLCSCLPLLAISVTMVSNTYSLTTFVVSAPRTVFRAAVLSLSPFILFFVFQIQNIITSFSSLLFPHTLLTLFQTRDFYWFNYCYTHIHVYIMCAYVCIPKHINTICSAHIILLICIAFQGWQPTVLNNQLWGSSLGKTDSHPPTPPLFSAFLSCL